MPSSYNNQIGIARSVCDMTSGGVSSIPTTKAPTITYGLLAARLFGVLTLVITNIIVTIGTSNAKPKAKKSVITKSRYLPISVITDIPSGAILIKNPKSRGKTTK